MKLREDAHLKSRIKYRLPRFTSHRSWPATHGMMIRREEQAPYCRRDHVPSERGFAVASCRCLAVIVSQKRVICRPLEAADAAVRSWAKSHGFCALAPISEARARRDEGIESNA